MKVLLTKASDWGYKEIKEIDNIMELKNFGNEDSDGNFVISFNFMRLMPERDKEKYKDCVFRAEIYDDYIE